MRLRAGNEVSGQVGDPVDKDPDESYGDDQIKHLQCLAHIRAIVQHAPRNSSDHPEYKVEENQNRKDCKCQKELQAESLT